MSRGIDEVEGVLLAVEGMLHLYGVALDGDAALAFKIHIVEHLVFEVAVGDGLGMLQQTVGESALAVVDVRYYAEISNVFHSDFLHQCVWRQSYVKNR